MSYCRWSSMNGYCDVYVYEDALGCWVTHVATHRPPPGAPHADFDLLFDADMKVTDTTQARYFEAQKKRAAWDKKNPSIPIDHPLAGESFRHSSPEECADQLETLKAEGFVVPDTAIQGLREEAAEADPSETDRKTEK